MAENNGNPLDRNALNLVLMLGFSLSMKTMWAATEAINSAAMMNKATSDFATRACSYYKNQREAAILEAWK